MRSREEKMVGLTCPRWSRVLSTLGIGVNIGLVTAFRARLLTTRRVVAATGRRTTEAVRGRPRKGPVQGIRDTGRQARVE